LSIDLEKYPPIEEDPDARIESKRLLRSDEREDGGHVQHILITQYQTSTHKIKDGLPFYNFLYLLNFKSI